MAIALFVGIMILDVARIIAHFEIGLSFGRISTGPGWVLGGDALFLLLLIRWHPEAGQPALIDVHPWQVVVALTLAAAVGHEVDRSGFGQFPILVTSAEYFGTPAPFEHLVYLPRGYYRSFGRWPLIFSLHGAGTMGRGFDRGMM